MKIQKIQNKILKIIINNLSWYYSNFKLYTENNYLIVKQNINANKDVHPQTFVVKK